ncbi:hypothetical protein VNO77_03178 [Canavalia gladiata]|uniref:Uncharacterized protein n=1 Tax=Canavalia gladiata TaxID=3824 RepID=A0AAN9MU95_CANGL
MMRSPSPQRQFVSVQEPILEHSWKLEFNQCLHLSFLMNVFTFRQSAPLLFIPKFATASSTASDYSWIKRASQDHSGSIPETDSSWPSLAGPYPFKHELSISSAAAMVGRTHGTSSLISQIIVTLSAQRVHQTGVECSARGRRRPCNTLALTTSKGIKMHMLKPWHYTSSLTIIRASGGLVSETKPSSVVAPARSL